MNEFPDIVKAPKRARGELRVGEGVSSQLSAAWNTLGPLFKHPGGSFSNTRGQLEGAWWQGARARSATRPLLIGPFWSRGVEGVRGARSREGVYQGKIFTKPTKTTKSSYLGLFRKVPSFWRPGKTALAAEAYRALN